jgi:TnpA family transposase
MTKASSLSPSPVPPSPTHPRRDETQELRRFYTLNPDDLALIDDVRGDGHRLALALTLVWARAERIMIADPAVLPPAVVAFVSAQLSLSPAVLQRFRGSRSPTTRAADAAVIREHLGLRTFGQGDARRLRTFLHAKVANTGNSAALLDACEEWILYEGLLRPSGETTIERIMYSARSEAEEALFTEIAGQLTPEQCITLDELCRTDGHEGHESPLAALGTPPRVPSAPAIAKECTRLESIRAVTPTPLDWGLVTPNRRRQWAALARRNTAQALRSYPSAKRYTLLLAFLVVRGEEVTDAIVEMFDTLIGRVFSHSEEELKEAKLQQAQARLEGARLFRTVAKVLLDPKVPSERVREEVFRRVPRERVQKAVEQQDLMLEQSEAQAYLAQVDTHFRYIRSFAPHVLATLRFGSTPASNELLEALEVLATMNAERRVTVPPTAPLGFIPQRWAQAIVRPEGVDRHSWEATLLYEVRGAVRASDLTVEGSRRYIPWDTDLYTTERWAARRPSWLEERGHGHIEDGAAYVRQALTDLHELTTDVAKRLPDNADAHIERGKLSVSALERVKEPEGIEATRAALTALIEPIDLPDLLMEVDRRTGYMTALTHLTGRRPPSAAHLAEIRPALFAVLVAEATNLGLATMARGSGISESQLTRVHDWYFREETLRQAITRLLQYHQTLPLTPYFGSGTTSSSDGMRFGVAASSLNARHNPRFMAQKRIVTAYSHVLDQGPQFWIDVVSCLVRESTYVLDGLVYQDAPPIQEHYTDTHGSTDLVFGLFEALGYRFAPRLRDLPDQVLYRAQKGVSYGALNSVLHQAVRGDLIVRHWDDINRLAASFKDGLVTPSLVIAKLQAMPRHNSLQQAIQELGHLAKTRHILGYVDDQTLRRRILAGLNKQERLHSLARIIFFGRQGRFGDRDYEAQLNRASALSLVINAIIVWYTEYLWLAAEELERRGQAVPEEMWAHITPLHWEQVHLVGRYSFEEVSTESGLRPLRIHTSHALRAPRT